jgi:hypothetical protein
VEVFKEPMASIYENAGCESAIGKPETVCFMVVQLMSRDESQLLSENFVFPARFYDVEGISYDVVIEVIFTLYYENSKVKNLQSDHISDRIQCLCASSLQGSF